MSDPNPTLHVWTFPAGCNTVTVRIQGAAEVNTRDMEAIQEAAALFTRQIRRREFGAEEPEFQI